MRRSILNALTLVVALVVLAVAIYKSYTIATDFTQDYLGAKALLNRSTQLYPLLDSAIPALGLEWSAHHRSTHPPTAFLLVTPFALFDYRIAAVLWTAAMFACLVLSARAFGIPWRMSLLAAALSLAWPPAFGSLYQLTPVWMLALVFAYRLRDNPLASGILVGIASLPKFLAAPALLYHLSRRKWTALIGFGAAWAVALALLFALRPDFLSAYLATPGNMLEQIRRPDNGALVINAWRLGGWLGLCVVAILGAGVIWTGLRRNDWVGWASFVWLGIALLPIAWLYSLLPLLPWLLLSLRTSSTPTRILAATALVLPYIPPVPSSRGGLIVALVTFVAGIVFVTTPKTAEEPTKVGLLPPSANTQEASLSGPNLPRSVC